MSVFLFCPTDTELLNHFLKPKIKGEQVSCNLISEKQIYGSDCNPWDVLDDSTPWIFSGKSKKITYVFTRLQNKAPVTAGGLCRRRKEYVKLAGCGSWNGLAGRMPIRVLGMKRELNFQINDVATACCDINKLGHYKLHEYVLSGCRDYALCRITLDASKTIKVVNFYSDDVSKIICTLQTLNVLGKRKSSEAQDYCSGLTKMLCM